MREPIALDQAEYKCAMAAALYETIMEKACDECSQHLLSLISIACDFNQEIHQSLIAALAKGESK